MRDKLGVAENKGDIIVDSVMQMEHPIQVMKQQTVSFRATEEDLALMRRLTSKLGIKTTQVIKIALRRFAEAEGMKLKAS